MIKNDPKVKAFLMAVATWKAYVKALKKANKANNSYAKSVLGKAVFYWINEAERLKKEVDKLVLCQAY